MATPTRTPSPTSELTPLTSSAVPAVTDLADLPSPSIPSHLSISAPQTPRWLSLSPYKAVPSNYAWEEELEAEVEEALVFSDEEDKGAEDEEQDRWGLESEEMSVFEKASERILAVLRCYMHNLEQGMLVTGSKVDSRVGGALQLLLGRALPDGNCRVEKIDEGTLKDMKESWEISDEERVAIEIGAFGNELRRRKEDVPEDVEDVAKEILQWARRKGTVNGSEMEMTSSRGSLEMIEC
jgi:hypothetical protein